MVDEPAKPRVVIWCIAALIALVAYPASFGPACWISERTEDDGKVLSFVYGPIIRLAFANETTGQLTFNYLKWGIRRNAVPVLSIRKGTISWTGFSFICGPIGGEHEPNRLLERPMPTQSFFTGGASAAGWAAGIALTTGM